MEVADEAFPLNGKVMPAGSLVIRCDQPYRAHVLDMLEPQWHPDDMRDGKPIPPYDAAGWTLSMQMDVQVETDGGDSQYQQHHDHRVDAFTGLCGYRLAAVYVLFALDAFRCQFEYP